MNLQNTDHERFMQRCLDLAWQGRYTVRGNPMVGAVLVARGIVIGEGYHRGWGLPHAEVEALAAVRPEHRALLREATLYVNLEPCSHHGKTPPCADRIVREGIPRVVIGMTDPNPKVAGIGVATLRSAGIETIENVMHEASRALNRAFVCRMEKKRPWVMLKWAQSADGFLAAADSSPVRFTNAWSDRLVHDWRAQCGAILVGARTVLMDNPQLTVRLSAGLQQEGMVVAQRAGEKLPLPGQPLRVVLDRYGQLPHEARVFDGQAPTLVVRTPDLPPDRYLLPQAEVMAIQFDRQLLPKLLQALAEREINSLMVEGGAETLKAFIREGLWDEARVFASQTVLHDGVPAPLAPGQRTESLTIGKDMLMCWTPG
ncbi:MAG: bifunctional diaminohydroxyphosphoribosylaminopyrimidine deaminase/5-amino-6-(5-phosphoribosylamino)uracil reductase RibD [Bacteroidetes bacterium]|nr:bifunctional diaminohydroxyphosphoribosylaminopyrimidine deaminase/5-amino-6-(5-phosphoribosylamino)uracil reductase RibD [Bacteroidota bacterium]